jgi:hypothetical protein
MTTAAEIWQTLSKIDVSDKIEKKGNLSYLSWAWAWGTLMNHFPQANYSFFDDTIQPDGSVMVHCAVHIGDTTRCMWLPVLNYKNQAIVQPSTMDINTARMRCLTKCLAMFGLGHYIYAGEDLPEAVKEENGQKTVLYNMFKKAIEDGDALMMTEVSDRMHTDWWNASYNSFKTNKTEQKRKVDELLAQGRQMFRTAIENYKAHQENDDELGMKETIQELPLYHQERLREAVK